jgi:hypothetical protein
MLMAAWMWYSRPKQLSDNANLFASNLYLPGQVLTIPHNINTSNNHPVKKATCCTSLAEGLFLHGEAEKMRSMSYSHLTAHGHHLWCWCTRKMAHGSVLTTKPSTI